MEARHHVGGLECLQRSDVPALPVSDIGAAADDFRDAAIHRQSFVNGDTRQLEVCARNGIDEKTFPKNKKKLKT